MNNKVFFNRAPLPQNEYAALPLTAIKPKAGSRRSWRRRRAD